jgi:hypothetical protein
MFRWHNTKRSGQRNLFPVGCFYKYIITTESFRWYRTFPIYYSPPSMPWKDFCNKKTTILCTCIGCLRIGDLNLGHPPLFSALLPLHHWRLINVHVLNKYFILANDFAQNNNIKKFAVVCLILYMQIGLLNKLSVWAQNHVKRVGRLYINLF